MLGEAICKELNTLLEAVTHDDDPIDYLKRLFHTSGSYYINKPWAAELLRMIRFDLKAAEQVEEFEKAVHRYREAMKAASLPGLKEPQAFEVGLNVMRALALGALNMFPLSEDPRYKAQAIEIMDEGIRTLIAGWSQ